MCAVTSFRNRGVEMVLTFDVKVTRAPNRLWLLVGEGRLGGYFAKVYAGT